MPFEWDNPIGYIFAVILQCILLTYVFFTMMILISIGVASYLYELSLTKDIKIILRTIDEMSKVRKNRPNLYIQFNEFVEVHSAAKQLSCKLEIVVLYISNWLELVSKLLTCVSYFHIMGIRKRAGSSELFDLLLPHLFFPSFKYFILINSGLNDFPLFEFAWCFSPIVLFIVVMSDHYFSPLFALER